MVRVMMGLEVEGVASGLSFESGSTQGCSFVESVSQEADGNGIAQGWGRAKEGGEGEAAVGQGSSIDRWNTQRVLDK